MELTIKTTYGDILAFEKEELKGYELTQDQRKLILTYPQTDKSADSFELFVLKDQFGFPKVYIGSKREGGSFLVGNISPLPIYKAPKKPKAPKVVPTKVEDTKVSQNGLNGVVKLANMDTTIIGVGNLSPIERYKQEKRARKEAKKKFKLEVKLYKKAKRRIRNEKARNN